MEKVVVFGTTKMAELVLAYFSKDSDYEIVAFTINEKYIEEKEYMGLPVVPFETINNTHPPDKYKMFIAIGYSELNTIRAAKYYEAKDKGYEFVSYISPRASMTGNVEIGENCFILENQVFQPEVKIGNNVIIWSGNHFGHDVVIGDHSFITSHVVISGDVKVGEYCFIGVNSTIRNAITIAPRCIIGAGSLMLNDTKEDEVYIENPTEKFPLDSNRVMKMFMKGSGV